MTSTKHFYRRLIVQYSLKNNTNTPFIGLEYYCMKTIERIPYKGSLPENFFTIPVTIYKNLPFKPSEDIGTVTALFEMEASRNKVIIYTDHSNIRLVGIFPLNEAIAYFGFWETMDDALLNSQAFALLTEDAKERNRISLIGPVNFNTYHSYRLRVGNIPPWMTFDREPVNPTYYPSLLQGLHFHSKATFESRMIRKENIGDVYLKKEDLLKQLNKIPFDFIPLNATNWVLYEDQIFELIHAIFSENPFYKSVSADQFKLLYNASFSRKLCPHSSVLFRDQVTGKLAAISMCHPNYQSLYPSITEPQFESDFERLYKKVLLAKTVGVHPLYRKGGLMNFMGAYGMLSFREWYDEIIFCLMRTDNYSLHFTNDIRHETAKYVLYEKHL